MISKKTLPRYAVLLAAYNGTNWIEAQIESILNQKNVEVELYISIDLSSDGTRNFLEGKYGSNKKIHILQDDGKFGGAAKNFYRLIRDVDFSDIDYVSLSDQDDIWNIDKLYNAHQLMIQHKCDGYSSNVMAFWKDGEKMLIDKAQKQTCYDYLFEAAGPGCTYVVSSKLALKIKEFITDKWIDVNNIALHDWLIYAFSRSNNFNWHIDKNTNMLYRQHSANQVGANTGMGAKLKRLEMIRSSWYRNETIKIITVLNIENSFDFFPLILKKSYLNNIKLVLHIPKFRRRFKDKISFLIICMLGLY
mgnify:CR=1 FL=1